MSRPKAPRARKPRPEPFRFGPGMAMLALDTSSQAIGWATMDHEGKLMDWGLITRSNPDVMKRIDWMADQVRTLVAIHQPSLVVMEIAGKGVSNPRTARGLPTLCHAQGAVREAIRRMVRSIVVVSGADWTGKIPKDIRAAQVREARPEIAGTRDPGDDIADAVGIGLWWLKLWAPVRPPRPPKARKPRASRKSKGVT
jgi:hypothetical protein